jgi:DNA-binding MarR family transcriptional regulator
MSTSQRVLDSIRRIVRLLREGSRASEDAVGLSAAQLFVLRMLDPERPLALKEVAARTLTHQSSVSVVVSRLVERGLVLRRPASDDARRLELLPTKKGLTLRDRAPEAAQQRIIDAIESLSAPKRRALADGLDALVTALGLDEVAPGMLDEEPRRGNRGKKRRA